MMKLMYPIAAVLCCATFLGAHENPSDNIQGNLANKDIFPTDPDESVLPESEKEITPQTNGSKNDSSATKRNRVRRETPPSSQLSTTQE